MANRNGGIYGFTALFPITSGTENLSRLRAFLRSLDQCPNGSLLAEVDIIHVARLAIIDQLVYEGAPAPADRLASDYLLFACDFDGCAVRDLAAALARAAPDRLEEIWGRCLAYPGIHEQPPGAATIDALDRYFRDCQVTTTLLLADQPDAKVSDILRALQLKRDFAAFVARVQGLAAADLRREFNAFWNARAALPPPAPGSI